MTYSPSPDDEFGQFTRGHLLGVQQWSLGVCRGGSCEFVQGVGVDDPGDPFQLYSSVILIPGLLLEVLLCLCNIDWP